MRVYVAGAWKDGPALSKRVQELEADGVHQCTHAWMANNVGLDTVYDAVADVQGVRDCELFIAVITDPTYPYRGTLAELTAAIALGN